MSDKALTWLFCIAIGVNIALASFPGIFDWSNTIKPWVLGMPFAAFWQLLLSTLAIACFAIWYLIEDKRGSLDDDVPEAEG